MVVSPIHFEELIGLMNDINFSISDCTDSCDDMLE